MRMIFNGSHQTGIHIFDLNIKNLGHTYTSVSQEYRSPVILPDVFPEGTNFSMVRPDGYKSYDQMIRQMRKWDVFIGNERRIGEISIHQVLDLTIVKKIYANNAIVLIFHSNHYIGVVLGV